MKKSILLLLLAGIFVISCSTDSIEQSGANTDMEQGSDDDSNGDAGDGSNSDDGSGDGNDGQGQDIMDSELVGVWLMTDLRFDESLNNDQLEFAKQILDYLNANGCDLVVLTFNEDGTANSADKIDLLSINVGVGGLEIPCPAESDMESSTWSLDGDQLTLVTADMEETTITITLEDENTLVIDGADIDPNNYQGAEAVFTKQVEE